jgi:chaperonin GroES
MARSATLSPSKINVRPLGAKVIVKRDEAEEKTESGLYLPEKAKDKPKSGSVLSVGPGSLNEETGERIPLAVKKGDKVLFTSYAGTEIKLNDQDLLILDEDDILAVIE